MRNPVGPTGTTSGPREGVGTILRVTGDNGTAVITLERPGGLRVVLTACPDVRDSLLREFGVRDSPTFIAVPGLIGLKVAYKESGTGMLTEVRPFRN